MDNGRHKLSICCCPEDPVDDDRVVIVVSRLAGPQIASFCWSVVSCRAMVTKSLRGPSSIHLPVILVVVIIDLNHFRFSHNNTVVVLLLKICLWEKQGSGKEYRLSSCRTRDPFGGVKEEKAATRKYNINMILCRSIPQTLKGDSDNENH